MGILDSFLKKVGLKSNQTLLQAGENNESITRERMDVYSSASDEFDNSLKVSRTPSVPKVQEVNVDTSDINQEKQPVLKVFAERGLDSSKIDYVVKLETDTGSLIPISVIKEKADEVSLKAVVSEISRMIEDLQKSSEKGYSTKKQAEIKQMMMQLSEKYKINFTGRMVSMVENASIGRGVNYQGFEKALPKTIDISQLTPAQIVEYGKMLTQRLETLDSIKTPEGAYKARVSLESFMKQQEVLTAQSAIVAANLENLENGEQTLDMPTIIACAKKMEAVSSEDGLLYSSYLKLEENRIIRKLQKEISRYQQGLEDTPENASTKQLADSLVDYLDSTKVSTGDNIQDNIPAYMIDTILGKGIENYAKNMVKNDIKLKLFLKNNPIEHQEEALDYVTAKMACLGQVVATPESEEYEEKIRRLRDFIEVTDYKDEDNSESKEFLYTIVQIERDYIKKNYSPILREFQKIVENRSK